MKTGASISPCGKYRGMLWRIWDDSKPLILWVMHNPSTANETDNDPTINKLIRLSKKWGYGGLYVGNIIPYRSTDPKNLKVLDGSSFRLIENKYYIAFMQSECKTWVAAFGNPAVKIPTLKTFSSGVWKALKITKYGNPYHPLYVKENTELIDFKI